MLNHLKLNLEENTNLMLHGELASPKGEGVERKPPRQWGLKGGEEGGGGRRSPKVPGGRQSQGAQGSGILGGFLACLEGVGGRVAETQATI